MGSSAMIAQFLGTTSWSSSSVTETGVSQWGMARQGRSCA